MKNELCLLTWVYILQQLLLLSEPTVALRVYHNNAYEVSSIDRRIVIPKPEQPLQKSKHNSIRRHPITLIEQLPRLRQHIGGIKPRHVVQRGYSPPLSRTKHGPPLVKQRHHIGSRRQEIIHALNEDTDKTDPEDDIESLGRRIDESGDEIKDGPKSEVTTTDKHTAAATRYIIAKIKEIQEKLFKRTGSKALEEKLNQMAPNLPEKKQVKNHTTLSNATNSILTEEKKNVTVPTPTVVENKQVNKTVEKNSSKSKDDSSKSKDDDSKPKDSSSEAKDNSLKPVADGSKAPDRRKIIPEEVVDKILEKFQQLKSEAKHIVSESRHSVEHAEDEGGKVVVNDEDGEQYEDTNESFNLPISSIQSAGMKNLADIQIPLKVFRGRVESGNRSAVIGVPILYVRNRYYLVPAFGAVDNKVENADVRSLTHHPEKSIKKTVSNNTSLDFKGNDFGIVSEIYHPIGASEKINIEINPEMAESMQHGKIAKFVRRNPSPTQSNLQESLVRDKAEYPFEGDQPCIEETFQIKTGSHDMQSNVCGTSTSQRRNIKQTTFEENGNFRYQQNGSQGILGSIHESEDVTERFYQSPNSPKEKANEAKFENEQTRFKRDYHETIPRPISSVTNTQYDRNNYQMDGPPETLNLVNKLIGTPDLPSVTEELRLARAKSNINNMPQNNPTMMTKTVPGNRRTFFDLNDFSQSEGLDYHNKDQLSDERPSVSVSRSFSDNENAFPIIGESKNFENSLNSFLDQNEKRYEDLIPESNTVRRSFQENRYEKPYHPNNDPEDTNYQSMNDDRSILPQPSRYDKQENSYNEDNTYRNNEIPYSNPNGPFTDNEKNVHDMSPEDMNRPYTKEFQSTTPEEIRFGLQHNLATSDSPEQTSMLDNFAMNDQINKLDPSSERVHNFQSLREYDSPRSREITQPRNTVQDIINQISHSGMNEHTIGLNSGRSIGPNGQADSFNDESALVREFMQNDSPFEHADPKLADKIDRLREETREMEKEYEVLRRNDRYKYGNSIEHTPQNKEMYNIGNGVPNDMFGMQEGQMGNNPDTPELQRAQDLFEINKFAGRDLTPMPKFESNTLMDKSPDELLEFARQNALQDSVKFNTNQYGPDMSGINMDVNSPIRSNHKTTEMGLARSPSIDPTGLLNHFSDAASTLGIGIRDSNNDGRLGSLPNAGLENHHDNEYVSELLRKVAAGADLNDLNMRGKVPYDINSRGSFSSNAYHNGYLSRGYIGQRQLPPGSLAAVSSGNFSPLRLIPSNIKNYNNGRYFDNYGVFNSRDYMENNFHHRADIPHPGKNETSLNTTSSKMTLTNNSLPKHNFNVSRSNNVDSIDDQGRFLKQMYQLQKILLQRSIIARFIKNLMLANTTSSNVSSINVTSEKISSPPSRISNTTKKKNARVIPHDISDNQFEEIRKDLDEVALQVKNIYQPKSIKSTDPLNKTFKRSEKSGVVNLFVMLNDQNNNPLNAAQNKKSSILARKRLNNYQRWLMYNQRKMQQKLLLHQKFPLMNKTKQKFIGNNMNIPDYRKPSVNNTARSIKVS